MAEEDLIKNFQAAADVNKIGFAQFTTDLITDTADAIVGSTIKQIKTFQELIKELAQGLDAFKGKLASPAAVADYLNTTFPNAEGTGTAIVEGGEYDQALYDRIIAELGAIDGLANPEGETAEFSEENVNAIRNAATTKLLNDAEGQYKTLENLVRIGFARVVFNQGHILTRLKFNVSAKDIEARQTGSTTVTNSRLGGGLSLSFGFLGLGFGGSRSRISVESVATQSFEAITMDANILGEVKVNFNTESFDLEKLKIEAKK